MLYNRQHLSISATFILRRWATVTPFVRGLISFRLGSTDWEISKISSIIFSSWLAWRIECWNELFQLTPHFENSIFHSIQPSFKMCILFCDYNRYSWNRFILTIPDAEGIAVVVMVEGEVRVTRILLLVVVIGIIVLLFIGGKGSDIK